MCSYETLKVKENEHASAALLFESLPAVSGAAQFRDPFDEERSGEKLLPLFFETLRQ